MNLGDYQAQAKRLKEIVSVLRDADKEIPKNVATELRELLDFVESTQEYHGEVW